jgi:hypothetical protein
MTDIELLMLRSLADLLTGIAAMMEDSEMEKQHDMAKTLNERAVEVIGHLNRKLNEAAAPSKFITEAVRDLENRPWPDDLNAP